MQGIDDVGSAIQPFHPSCDVRRFVKCLRGGGIPGDDAGHSQQTQDDKNNFGFETHRDDLLQLSFSMFARQMLERGFFGVLHPMRRYPFPTNRPRRISCARLWSVSGHAFMRATKTVETIRLQALVRYFGFPPRAYSATTYVP